jgi:uncharacterized membrane protein YwaF
MDAFAQWLAGTYVSQLFGAADWPVPLVQTFHILGIAATLTPMLMLDIRLLRQGSGGAAVAESVRTLMPWFWRGLIVLLLSGLLLILAEPGRELESTPFQIKMLLVVVLACMMFVVQKRLQGQADYWSSSPARRHAASAIGAVSVVICMAIVAAGRLIAYITHG